MSAVIASQFVPTQLCANNRKTGADADASYWMVPPGSEPRYLNYFGLFATQGFTNTPVPAGPYYLFQGTQTDLLVPPTGFTKLWACVDNGHSGNLGFFAPNSPSGYLALGSVAVPDFNNPPQISDFYSYRCVAASLCQQITLTKQNLVWTDKGSGVSKDVSVWLLPTAQVFIATISDGYPSSMIAWDLNPNNVYYDQSTLGLR